MTFKVNNAEKNLPPNYEIWRYKNKINHTWYFYFILNVCIPPFHPTQGPQSGKQSINSVKTHTNTYSCTVEL